MNDSIHQVQLMYAEKHDAAERFGASVVAALKSTSQRALAEAVGVSQPYIAQVAKRYRSAYDSNPYLTLDSLATIIGAEVNTKNDQAYMIRMIAQAMTDFRALVTSRDQERFMTEPSGTGSTRWDAMISAMAEREARLAGIKIPEWVYSQKFILKPWWFLSPTESLRAYSFQHSAPEFAHRNVYIDAASLESI